MNIFTKIFTTLIIGISSLFSHGSSPSFGSTVIPINQGGTATTTGGVTNGVETYNGSTLTNGYNFNYNGTNVGIGTTTPYSLLGIGNTSGIGFSSATSTFNTTGGIDLRSGGCYSISGTCIGSATVTSVGLSDSNSTLTIGGSPVTTSGTLTATLNLGHANTWTTLQTFGANASSSVLSSNVAQFGGTATTTFTKSGGVNTNLCYALSTSTAMVFDWNQSCQQTDYQMGTLASTLTFINATTTANAGSIRRIVYSTPSGGTPGAMTLVGVEYWGTPPTQSTAVNLSDIYVCNVDHATSTAAVGTLKVICSASTGGQ